MNSSGIKRGLATTAITALAVTGIPFLATSANATPLVEQEAASNVSLQTTDNGVASFKNDGVESTVHLVATGGSNVSQVQFRYSVDAGATWVNIGSPTSRTSGAFSTEWAPPPAIFNTAVQVQAQALNSIAVEIDTDTNPAVTVTANQESVDIAYAPGASVGYFEQPYTELVGLEVQDSRLAAISGTTSDLAGDPTLTFSTPYNAVTTTEDVAGTVAPGATSRSYSGPINLDSYPVDVTAPLLDEALFRATADGDDAEPVVLNKQTITTVTAVADPATVQAGGAADITVTVLDAAGKPVVGAQVVAEDADASFPGSGIANAKYTNSQGQAVFPQADGAATPGATYDFYVNTTDVDAYEPGVDFRRSATVTSYAPTATTITSTSADGAAFDVDEAGANDLQAKVLDQNGQPLANQTVSYSLSIAPFVAPVPPATSPAPTTGTLVTNAQGLVSIPFVDKGNGTYTLRTFVERDGTPGQSAGDLAATDLVFKAGDSVLAFTDAPTATSPSGTTDTYDATLKLTDGTPLPGRAVRFTFAQAGGGNVVVSAQGNQPAGTTRVSDSLADDVTDASGTVSVALSDPATPDQAELNGALDADTQANAIGNALEDAADLDVDFVDSTPPALTTVTLTADAATHKPGMTTGGTVTVVADTDGDPNTVGTTPVVGLAVTLTVDKGFFTDGTPDPAPAVGADQGEFKSLGQTITVVTGAGGVANFQTAIERDAGFDDDGLVKATVTATAGAFNDTEDYDYSSASPLNGGTVELVESPASEQDGDTDPARVNQDVAYDVFATDQFGNLVGGASVVVTDDSSDATVTGSPVLSDFDDQGDFTVTSSEEEDVVITGTWTAPVNEYVADGIDVDTIPDAGAPTTRAVTDTDTASFYAIDFAASTLTITSTPEGTVPVGTAVTETVKVVDQEGRPVQGYDVEFFRTGPDAGGGDANVDRTTNANGEAFYTFIGSESGTAQITATVTDGESIRTLTDTVVFGSTPPPGRTPIEAVLGGRTLGEFDRLRVAAPAKAAGAVVRLYKVVNGKRIQVGNTRGLNAKGNVIFSVVDRNGNKRTKYVAVVRKTAVTLGDTTNPKSLR